MEKWLLSDIIITNSSTTTIEENFIAARKIVFLVIQIVISLDNVIHSMINTCILFFKDNVITQLKEKCSQYNTEYLKYGFSNTYITNVPYLPNSFVRSSNEAFKTIWTFENILIRKIRNYQMKKLTLADSFQ